MTAQHISFSPPPHSVPRLLCRFSPTAMGPPLHFLYSVFFAPFRRAMILMPFAGASPPPFCFCPLCFPTRCFFLKPLRLLIPLQPFRTTSLFNLLFLPNPPRFYRFWHPVLPAEISLLRTLSFIRRLPKIALFQLSVWTVSLTPPQNFPGPNLLPRFCVSLSPFLIPLSLA